MVGSGGGTGGTATGIGMEVSDKNVKKYELSKLRAFFRSFLLGSSCHWRVCCWRAVVVVVVVVVAEELEN
jgi:hypothetical protein